MAQRHTNNRTQEILNNFGVKYSNKENIIKKAEWISNMAIELGLEEGPKAEIYIYLLRMTNRKTPDHDGIHGFWFKKFTTIHDRQTLEMNVPE